MDLTGTHSAKAISAVLGESKTGTAQVVIDFEITDVDGSPHIACYLYFTDKTDDDRAFESLRICGWTGNDWTNISVGSAVELVIELAPEFEGKRHQRVKWINRPGGVAMAKPMDAGKIAAFAAKMKGKLLAFDQKSGTAKPKPAPSGANPPPPADSDAPPF